MVTSFCDIFVAGICLFRNILVCINIITNDKIVEFFNFVFKPFGSFIIRITFSYQKEYALTLTPLVANMTSYIMSVYSF